MTREGSAIKLNTVIIVVCVLIIIISTVGVSFVVILLMWCCLIKREKVEANKIRQSDMTKMNRQVIMSI